MCLVILDIGATLVQGPSRGPASRLAAELGIDSADKRVLANALLTRPFVDPREVAAYLVDELGIDRSRSDAAALRLWRAQCTEASAVDGAVEAVLDLVKAGARLGLISNIWFPYLTSVRTHFGELFDQSFASELQLYSFLEGSAKPDPELFGRALDRAGVPAAEAVMIGDSYAEDIAPAVALGMATIWVLSRPERERGALTDVLNGTRPGPTRAVGSISELTMGCIEDALRSMRNKVLPGGAAPCA